MRHKRLLILAIAILIALGATTGCGGGGAGTPGSTGDIPAIITASVMPGTGLGEAPGSEGSTVDAFATQCTTGTYSGQQEPFRIHMAELTISATPAIQNEAAVATDTLTIENFKLEFFPQTPGAPPIAEFNGVFQTLTLPNDGTAVKLTVPLIDIDRKLQWAKDVMGGAYKPDIAAPLYIAKYTFYGKDIYGHAFTVVSQTSFWIGDFDSCTSTTTGGA